MLTKPRRYGVRLGCDCGLATAAAAAAAAAAVKLHSQHTKSMYGV